MDKLFSGCQERGVFRVLINGVKYLVLCIKNSDIIGKYGSFGC